MCRSMRHRSSDAFPTNFNRRDVSIGFPKRPRYRVEPHQRHPSLETYKALPDGLYKGRIQLEKHMIPSFDWVGLRVKVR